LTNEPNTWVDVTDTVAIKIAAIKEHKSQIKDLAELEQRIRDRLRRTDVDRELYVEGSESSILRTNAPIRRSS